MLMNDEAYGQIKNKAGSAIAALVAAVFLTVMAARPAGAGFSEFNENVKDALTGDWGKINSRSIDVILTIMI